MDGNFLRKFGSRGSARGQFNKPSNIAFDRNDNVFIGDFRNERVQIFGPDGAYISEFGGNIEPIVEVYGVCIDSEGLVFVGARNQVHVFGFVLS